MTRPPSVATAIDTLTDGYATSPSSLQVTLASGTSPKAAATAMTTKSLTEIFTGAVSLIRSRSASSSSTTHSVVM